MKKALCLILCLWLSLSLCGCSAKKAVANNGQEYIVSAFGFDRENGGLKITMEALVVNSDNLDEENKARLIYGKGVNVIEAFSKIGNQITQPLTLGHCGAVVISQSVGEGDLQEILEFLSREKGINVATMMVYTENSQRLLSGEPISSVAMGYDLMSMTEVVSSSKGINFENRFFQVQSALRKPLKTFSLPRFEVTNKGFALSSIAVLKQNQNTVFLNLEETGASGFISDRARKGEYFSKNQSYDVEYSKTNYDFKLDGRLEITLNIHLKTDRDKRVLKEEILTLFRNFKTESGDIWGLGNIIYQKEPEIWEKIKDNYEEHFKKSDLRVNFYE